VRAAKKSQWARQGGPNACPEWWAQREQSGHARLSCRVPASPAPWLELILVIKRLEAPLSRGGGWESIHMRWADPLVRFLDFFVRVVHT
jgi:hypothetical protein